MQVTYADWTHSEAEFEAWLVAWARAHPGASICDVGGGANPSVPARERAGRRYLVVDIDRDELEKCPSDVEKAHADVSRSGFDAPGTFDLVISRTVAEHVRHPDVFHGNVRRLLRPGGTATHYFPALGALPFAVNRLLPEEAGQWILMRIQDNRARGGHHEKFPALYRGCRGPTRRQIALYRRSGFEVETFNAYFGHGYYWPVGIVDRLEKRKTQALLRRPVPQLVSYAHVVRRAG
jgi:SAM-dependent methyltransferase